MRILLIRHGEMDKKSRETNQKCLLSDRGKDQAERAAEIIKAFYEKEYGDRLTSGGVEGIAKNYVEKFIKNNPGSKPGSVKNVLDMMGGILTEELKLGKPKIRLWQSPFARARQTAKAINETLGNVILDTKEHVLLCEHQFGILYKSELARGACSTASSANYYADFNTACDLNGKFFVRYPFGESSLDVAMRIQNMINLFNVDAENEGINDLIVVCHGAVICIFTMLLTGKTPEWYEEEETPGNCSIRLIDNGKDCGYIFGGFKDGKAWEYRKLIKQGYLNNF